MRLDGRVSLALVAIVLTACSGAATPPPPPPAPIVAPPRPAPIILASPGPLAAPHGALGCLDCHASGDAVNVEAPPVTINDKCLGCHEHQVLRARIAAGKGFHASSVVRGKACSTCHLDHRGPRYTMVDWRVLPGGQQGFDHAQTGWPLNGKHATVACAQCHARDRFMGTDRLCGSCHPTPHATTRVALLACDRCHTLATWKPPKRVWQFDHDDRKDAAMPVFGVHATLACVKCHTGGVFTRPATPPATPASCANCHAGPHGPSSVFSRQPCEACHSPVLKTFKIAMFDHSEHTNFDLGVSHNKLACATCHSAALGATPPPAACETCHAARAVHKDRFKALGAPVPPCGMCHAPNVPFDPAQRPAVLAPWPARRFDHRRNGGWALTGKHSILKCRDCHRGRLPTDFERFASHKDCTNCHAHTKVHDNKYTNAQCLQCHTGPI